MTKKLVLYRKTVLIQAEQFDGSKAMAAKYGIHLLPNALQAGRIKTLEGTLTVPVSSWIATGINGEHWPIADEVFRKTYEPLPVIPKPVGKWIELCRAGTPADFSNCINGMVAPVEVVTWGNALAHPWREVIARAWLDGYQIEEDADDDANS